VVQLGSGKLEVGGDIMKKVNKNLKPQRFAHGYYLGL